MTSKTNLQLHSQLNERTARQLNRTVNVSTETLYNVYNDKVKLNDTPLTQIEAYDLQREFVLNYGYEPIMIPINYWCKETKKQIELILISLFIEKIGIDVPSNFDEIVLFCFNEVGFTADTTFWNNDDVAIAFRRWIEQK